MNDEIVRLRVGGVVFDVEKSTLLKVKGTFFYGLLSSGAWQPDADGVYSIDRPAWGFDRILEYLSSGELSVEGLTKLEEYCVYSNMDYLLIPYRRKYSTHSVLYSGYNCVCVLEDGRFCGAYDTDIIIRDMYAHSTEMIMKGHTYCVNQVIQLRDGRVCSCSNDRTIKLWNIDSGLCEVTLTGHTRSAIISMCIIQLFDGRLCSGSGDHTIRVWNISTGVCEMTIRTLSAVSCLAQLSDGRICCGVWGRGFIPIYSMSGIFVSLRLGSPTIVFGIVCIGSTKICACSVDRTIRVFNTVTLRCERILMGHTGAVLSLVLLQDGRLCSGSCDGIIKLWNLETGKCENNLDFEGKCDQVLQLDDGRLLVSEYIDRARGRIARGVLLFLVIGIVLFLVLPVPYSVIAGRVVIASCLLILIVCFYYYLVLFAW